MAFAHLKWEDIHTSFGCELKSIWKNEEFFDVTLVCENQQLSAHKVVLSACSSFFRSVLTNNPHPNPLIYLKDVSYQDLSSILSFIYTGEAEVQQDRLQDFLGVAEDLRIKGLLKSDDDALSSVNKVITIPPNHVKEEFPEEDDNDKYDDFLFPEVEFSSDTMTMQNRVECTLCGKSFKNKKLRQTHMRKIHGISSFKPEYFCEVCNKMFRNRKYLKSCKHEENTVEANFVEEVDNSLEFEDPKKIIVNVEEETAELDMPQGINPLELHQQNDDSNL